ncbi:MAG: hypothetical protein R3E98_21805, partial [Gemmatimonadota bacterium]
MNGPPRWLEALLVRVLGPERAEEVEADLAELRAARGQDTWGWRDTGDALRLVLAWRLEEGGRRRAPGTLRRGLGALARDLGFALRRVRRSPATSAAILATLALAVGITTALFSVIDAVLLRGLPFPDAERLVVLHEIDPADGARAPLAPPTLED